MKRNYIEPIVEVMPVAGRPVVCVSGGNVSNEASNFMGFAPVRAGNTYL